MAFLDETGLAHLWDKILKKFGDYVTKESGKGLSEANYTAAEKQKLANIAEGATSVTIDSAMSSASTNPVQNKVVYAALAEKAKATDVTAHTGSTTIHVPACTTSDNGKFLRVSSGVAAWTTVDNAEGVTF